MYNIIMLLIYIIVSILMWVSICFKLSDIIWGEETLFSSKMRARMVYVISLVLGVVMTILGYISITLVQQIV